MTTAYLTRLGMCAALLFTFTSDCLRAQVSDIATDGTGSALIMRSNFRLQRESDVTVEQKIYVWSGGQWSRLAASKSSDGQSPVPLDAPFVAMGGSIAGWKELPSFTCCGFSSVAPYRPNTIVKGLNLPDSFPTQAIDVSPNGRYVVGWTQGFASTPDQGPLLLDTSSGAVEQISVTVAQDNLLPQVADDGTVVYLNGDGTASGNILVARSPSGATKKLPVDGDIGTFLVSPNALWVAVKLIVTPASDANPMGKHKVLVWSPESGKTFEILDAAEVSPAASIHPAWGLTDHSVTYIGKSGTELRTLNLDTGESGAIFYWEESFTGVAVAGYGGVIWAVTETNRLLRMEEGKTAVQVLPPLGSANSSSIQGTRVPGSAMLLAGKFTSEQTISLYGDAWPVMGADESGLWVQIPWEWVPDPSRFYQNAPLSFFGELLLLRSAGNPFEAVIGIQSDGLFWPSFPKRAEPASPDHTIGIAAHSDFHGVASVKDPARAGELLHIYMTGLGALDTDVPTGVPGPIPADPIVQPITCTGSVLGSGARTNVAVYSSVYASGLIGFYQVDLTVPLDVPDGFWALRCGLAEKEAFAWIPTRP